MSEKKGGFSLFRKKEDEDLEKEEARAEEIAEKRRKAARKKTEAEIRERHEKEMKAAKAKREAEEEAKAKLKVHVVEKGDTLTAIALKYYGNAGEFMKIYEANKEVIGDNPDRILVGQELVIPELE